MTDEIAGLLATKFIMRRDVKAEQQSNGIYVPDRTKWTMADLRAHVAGTKTYGHYMLSQDDEVKLFAFDIDLEPIKNGLGHFEYELPDGSVEQIDGRDCWRQKDPLHPAYGQMMERLRIIADTLAGNVRRLLDIPVAVAYSGSKGVHVYGFTGPITAKDARDAGKIVMEEAPGSWAPSRGENFWASPHLSGISIEVYPKQDSLDGKDLGNLMRLPLGVHRKTRQQGFFLDPTAPVNSFVELDPIVALTGGPWSEVA